MNRQKSATLEAIHIAKDAGALISYDPNYRASLWRNEQTAVQEMKAVIPFADVMKVSDEESLLLTGKNSYEEAAEELLSMGPELIAITLGSDGVLVATTDGKEQIRGFATEAVDTTGAGDSFWGGFLSQFLSLNKAIDEMNWNDLRACARRGKCSSMSVCAKERWNSCDSKETRSNGVFKSTYQKINWISCIDGDRSGEYRQETQKKLTHEKKISCAVSFAGY